jgi:hypothetical protein
MSPLLCRFFCLLDWQIFTWDVFHSDIFNTETFCYGDVWFRRRCVTGDVVLRRRSVTERFCKETFCMSAFLIITCCRNLCIFYGSVREFFPTKSLKLSSFSIAVIKLQLGSFAVCTVVSPIFYIRMWPQLGQSSWLAQKIYMLGYNFCCCWISPFCIKSCSGGVCHKM